MNSIKLSQLLTIFVLSGIQTIVCQGNKFKGPIKSPSQLTPSNPNIQPISHQTSQQTSSHPAKPDDDDYDDDIPDAANVHKIGQARPNVQANHPNTTPLSANNKAKLDLIRKSSPKTPVPPRSVSNSNLEHEDRVTPSPTLYGLLKSVPPPTRPVRPLKQFKSLPLKAITLHPNGNNNIPNQLISRANNAKPVVTLPKNNIEVLTTTIDPEHCDDTNHTEETITMKPIVIKSDNLPHSPVHESVVGSHPIPNMKPNDHSNADHNNDLDDILDYGEDVPHEVANHTNDLATSLPEKANQELTNGTEVITPSIPVAQKIPSVQRSPDGVAAMPHSQNDPDSINDSINGAVLKAPQRGVTTEPHDQSSTDEESGPPPAQVNVVQPSHSSTTENLNRLLQNPGSPTDLESDGGHPRNGSANNDTETEIPSASLEDSLPEEGVAAIGDHIDVPLDKVRKHLLDKLSQLSDHEDLNDETSAMAHRLKDIFNEFAAKQINDLTDDDLDGDHIKPIAAVTLDDSPDVRANQMREALKHIKDKIANKPDQEHHDGPDGPDDDHDVGDHLAKVKHHLEKASQIQSSDNNTGNPKMPMVIPLTIPSRRQNQLPPFLLPPRGIWPPTGPFIFSQALQPRRRGQGLRPPPLLPMLPNPQTMPNFPFLSMKRTQVMAPNRRQFNRPFNPTIMINPQVIHTQQNFGADKWSQPQAFPPNNRRRSLSNSRFQPIMNQIEMTYVPNQMQSSSNPLRRALSSPSNQFSMFRMTPNQNSGQRLNSQLLRQLILNANRH